jgi:flagellar hook assembly protein FlgD
VRTLSATATASGDGSLAWDGRTTAGTVAPDGTYAVTLVATDPAGNASTPVATAVDVYAALASVARTPSSFYPQDGDRLAASTSVSFRLLAAADASAAVVDAGGAVVRTLLPTTTLPAGPRTYAWDGRRTDGTFAPRGVYRFVVMATNGTQGASGSATVRADAFKATTSVATATRGRSFALTVVSVERLSTTPRVTVSQPGRASWTVTMKRVATKTWRVVVTPRSGATGTLVLSVSARDRAGGRNRTTVRLPLR